MSLILIKPMKPLGKGNKPHINLLIKLSQSIFLEPKYFSEMAWHCPPSSVNQTHTFSHFFSSSIFSSFCPVIISNISECSYLFTISCSCLPSSLLRRLPWLQFVPVCPFEFLLCLIVFIASLLFIQLYKGHRE